MLTSGFPFLWAAALKRRLTSELALIPISSYSCGSGSCGIGSESGSLLNQCGECYAKSNEDWHVQFLMGRDCYRDSVTFVSSG